MVAIDLGDTEYLGAVYASMDIAYGTTYTDPSILDFFRYVHQDAGRIAGTPVAFDRYLLSCLSRK